MTKRTYDEIMKREQQGLRNAMSMIPIETAYDAFIAENLYTISLSDLLTIPDDREEFFRFWVELSDTLNDEIDLTAIRNTAIQWGEQQRAT